MNCVICGKPTVNNRKTCSDECKGKLMSRIASENARDHVWKLDFKKKI